MKKSIAWGLAFVMLGLSSCGSQPQNGDNTAASDNTDTAAVDDLPELDFGGVTARMLIGDYQSGVWCDFYAEEENGNRINDVLYQMKQEVDDRLNINLEFYRYSYEYADTSAYNTYVTQLIMSGSDEFDVSVGSSFVAQQAENDYFLDLSSNKYINLEKPWWNQSVANCMPTKKITFATGDGILSFTKNTMCMYFNQNLFSDYGITDNLYEMVENGKWTLDKLEAYTKMFYQDVNGNTEFDFADTYGLTFGDENKYVSFINSLGIKQVIKTQNGYSIEYGSERACDAVARVCELVNGNVGAFKALPNKDHEYLTATGGGTYASRIFTEGRAAFEVGIILDAATIIPNAAFTCGILPMPKYDEAQENYVAQIQKNRMFTIPASCRDEDLSGAVMEAWSSLAYRKLQPEYFEVTLKVRYSNDEAMARMFDLIRETQTLDIGAIFSGTLGDLNAKFKSAVVNNSPDWASFVAANIDTWRSKMDEAWEIYQ